LISVVIPTLNDAQRLTATLAALAPAAVDGLVRQVIVADGGSSDETLAVADDAGADVVSGALSATVAAARQPWVLVLAAGARPQVGWEQAAYAHMRDYPDSAGWFDLALPEVGAAARLREFGAALLRTRPAGLGPLIKARRLEAFQPIASHEALARRLPGRRIGARALLMK
jgi:glycosyltransferase involved in cell wall biosynthesis